MKKILLILTLFIILFFVGCEPDNSHGTDIYKNKRMEIQVGNYKKCGTYSFVNYKGMVNDKTFVIGMAGRGESPSHVYYPVDIIEFTINNHIFEVEEVTPYEIVVIYRGKKKE